MSTPLGVMTGASVPRSSPKRSPVWLILPAKLDLQVNDSSTQPHIQHAPKRVHACPERPNHCVCKSSAVSMCRALLLMYACVIGHLDPAVPAACKETPREEQNTRIYHSTRYQHDAVLPAKADWHGVQAKRIVPSEEDSRTQKPQQEGQPKVEDHQPHLHSPRLGTKEAQVC